MKVFSPPALLSVLALGHHGYPSARGAGDELNPRKPRPPHPHSNDKDLQHDRNNVVLYDNERSQTCPAQKYNVNIDVQIKFPDDEFAACNNQQDVAITAEIQAALNENFAMTVSDWEGDVVFGVFTFDPDQEVKNVKDRSAHGTTPIVHSQESGRVLREGTCSERNVECDGDFCRWGCTTAATTDCGTSSLTNWVLLIKDVHDGLAGLGFDCLGILEQLEVKLVVAEPECESEMPTPTLPPSGMMGDPHIKSWKGEFFDWMGECDLKLFHVSNFGDSAHDLTAHVRTTIRYDYSFIETAAVRIGDDTLEVSAWGDYSFNGVEGALTNPLDVLGFNGRTTAAPKIGGHPIFHTQISKIKHEFDIVLGHNQNITITSMKDLVSLEIRQPTERYFGYVEGLLGNFHGKMLARDGNTNLHDDINAMANEWQVRDDDPTLFRFTREPQYPAKCRLPDVAKKEARRLGEGIDEENAEVACAHLKNVDLQLFAACVYDVTATNDIDQADAY